jgi:hypothetical protein
MLMKVRYKDHKDRVHTGIPLQQWTMPTKDGDKLRIYLLMPVKRDDDRFCAAHVVIEEAEEWLVIGKDKDYTNRPLSKKELLIVDNQAEEDLYLVWDDGADAHIERARRLYLVYKNEIEALLY